MTARAGSDISPSPKLVRNADADIADWRSCAGIRRIGRGVHEPRSFKVGVSIFNSPQNRIGERVFDTGASGPTIRFRVGCNEGRRSGKGERNRTVARSPPPGAEDEEAVERDAKPTADRAVVLGRC